jgi:hypothetical protein
LEKSTDQSYVEKYLTEQEKTLKDSHFVDWDVSSQCCIDTIDSHAQINPIMVCGTCRHIIKCFSDERSYKNFLAFCHSRGRNVKAVAYDDYYVVIFQSHGNV